MEFQLDGSFKSVPYGFLRMPDGGWLVLRQDRPHLSLGEGFVAIENRFCGVCSTDLARAALPFPLPQVTGHEVVGRHEGRTVVVEINASHRACDLHWQGCAFCSKGLANHCPDRLTLGIDRLPGGFAPWLLAPRAGVFAVPPGVTPIAASLTEPLAAALQAVEATPPRSGDRVAVLGPRRLGMLLVAALVGFRRSRGLDFEICARARHDNLLQLATELGADRAIDTRTWTKQPPGPTFDIVFDTSGSADGFALALALARRVLHVKSTNGSGVMGLEQLYAMVVDELALLPLNATSLAWRWADGDGPTRADGTQRHLYVSPTLPEGDLSRLPGEGCHFYRLPAVDALRRLEAARAGEQDFPPGAGLPRFDGALVTSLAEAGQVMRPAVAQPWGLVRPRGAILLAEPGADRSPLAEAICGRGLQLHASRCGNFERALALLAENPTLAEVLEERLITHRFPLGELAQAVAVAADSRVSIKVIVDTN